MRIRSAVLAAVLLLTTAGAGGPASAGPPGRSGPKLERLDRGLVAVATGTGVFLSWRLLATEATGSGATGLTGVNFRVYRDGRPIAVVTDSTNYLDASGTGTSVYRVVPVSGGK